MRGGPIDLTPFGSVLTAIGMLYWVVAIGVLVLATRLPKTKRAKIWAALTVLAVFGAMPVARLLARHQARSALDESMALFQERCKTAGEKVTRTVDNVEGVVWMKWRESSDKTSELYNDQFKLFDPYGRDCGSEECIASLLKITTGAALNPEETKRRSVGYQFIETSDPSDGQRYRYAAHLEHGWTAEQVERHKKETGSEVPAFSYHLKTSRVPIEKFSSRYGLVWEDISTREDREHWIAGGAIRVIDLETSQPIAERIGYLIDTGQGGTGGFRSPWGWAKSYAPRCPPKDESTHDFVVRILKPRIQGE